MNLGERGGCDELEEETINDEGGGRRMVMRLKEQEKEEEMRTNDTERWIWKTKKEWQG